MRKLDIMSPLPMSFEERLRTGGMFQRQTCLVLGPIIVPIVYRKCSDELSGLPS